MTKTKIMQKMLNEITLAEFIAVLNNEELDYTELKDSSRITYIKRNIKSIEKIIMKSILEREF